MHIFLSFSCLLPVPENPNWRGGGAKVQKLGKTWTRWEKLGWQARHNGTNRASPSHPYLAAVTSRLAGCEEISPFLETTVLAANLTQKPSNFEKTRVRNRSRFSPAHFSCLAGKTEELLQSCRPCA